MPRAAKARREVNIERMIGVAEICDQLGVADRTLRRLVSRGKFPKPDKTVGRQLRWKESTVKAWMDGEK